VNSKSQILLIKTKYFQLYVQFTVLMVVALYCIETDKDTTEALFFLVSSLAAVIIQSGGTFFTLRVFEFLKRKKLPISEITAYPFGLYIKIPRFSSHTAPLDSEGVPSGQKNHNYLKPRISNFEQIFLYLAGPLLNITAGLFIYTLFFNSLQQIRSSTNIFSFLAACNIVYGFISLLPLVPLPGGFVLISFLEIFSRKKNKKSAILKEETVVSQIEKESQVAQDPQTTLKSKLSSQMLSALVSEHIFYLKPYLKFSQIASFLLAILFLSLNGIALSIVFILLFAFILKLQLELSVLSVSTDLLVKDVMRPINAIDTLPHGMSIKDAVNVTLKSFQEVFPVLHAEQLLGVVDRGSLIKFRGDFSDQRSYLTQLIRKDILTVKPHEPLLFSIERISFDTSDPILVVDNGSLLGVIIVPHLIEALVVKAIEKSIHKDTEFTDDFYF
jgi:hypothetical protein